MEFQVLPICPLPKLIGFNFTAKPIDITLGTPYLTSNGRIAVKIGSNAKDLEIDVGLLITANIQSVTAEKTTSGVTLFTEIADKGLSAVLTLPSASYYDADMNPGIRTYTLTFPAAPKLDLPRGDDNSFTVTSAAVAVSALLASAIAGWGNLGRSITNIQFYAWSIGLAVPYMPTSYKRLTNALKWAAFVSKSPDRLAATAETSVSPSNQTSAVANASAAEGLGEVPVRALRGIQDADTVPFLAQEPLSTEEDLIATLRNMGTAFAVVVLVHFGVQNMPCVTLITTCSLQYPA